MEWEVLKDFIRPELLILAVVLYCIGAFLKLLPSFQNEWAIPFILLGTSLVLTPLYMCVVLKLGWEAEVIMSGIIQAVLLASLSVFVNQMIKQLTKERKIDMQKIAEAKKWKE